MMVAYPVLLFTAKLSLSLGSKQPSPCLIHPVRPTPSLCDSSLDTQPWFPEKHFLPRPTLHPSISSPLQHTGSTRMYQPLPPPQSPAGKECGLSLPRGLLRSACLGRRPR